MLVWLDHVNIWDLANQCVLVFISCCLLCVPNRFVNASRMSKQDAVWRFEKIVFAFLVACLRRVHPYLGGVFFRGLVAPRWNFPCFRPWHLYLSPSPRRLLEAPRLLSFLAAFLNVPREALTYPTSPDRGLLMFNCLTSSLMFACLPAFSLLSLTLSLSLSLSLKDSFIWKAYIEIFPLQQRLQWLGWARWEPGAFPPLTRQQGPEGWGCLCRFARCTSRELDCQWSGRDWKW